MEMKMNLGNEKAYQEATLSKGALQGRHTDT